MAKLAVEIRFIAGALALALMLALAAPASAQRVDPNAAAVQEQQLLKGLGTIQGLGTIPDKKSYTLEHPAGRDWRQFHTVWLKAIGGVAIIGMLVALALFYMWRGRMRIEGGRSGRKLVRFTGVERFVHWLTASTFVILGITGLNITFGRALILPWMGPEAFSAWSEYAKYVHNYLSFAFTIGVVLMFLMWIGQNFPTAADIQWLKAGGGMFSKGHGPHPPAYKFNAGQKILYWLIIAGGTAMIISGFVLLFPFYYGLNVGDMELAEIFHGVVGVMFVALIIAHIYLGTLGMEGAFEAMSEGTVDLNWAKEHHSLWYKQEMEREAGGKGGAVITPTPAE
ncbi:MAG TPA: formate dehydrogenase subunit gamma [Pseudolabrys sp.]|nr:formate dehydrogenase subunit gamma [Pseudolabrys sp.]